MSVPYAVATVVFACYLAIRLATDIRRTRKEQDDE